MGCRLHLPMVRSVALLLSPVSVGAGVGRVSRVVSRAEDNVAGRARPLQVADRRQRRRCHVRLCIWRRCLRRKCRWDVAVDACSAYHDGHTGIFAGRKVVENEWHGLTFSADLPLLDGF